jgi:signal transduction histidine kinase
MSRWRASHIVVTYSASLAITIALLVVWVVYVVRSVSRIREMAGRIGVSSANPHWVILGVGCILFFLLIGGLTYQLAQTLAARRYSQKQEEFVSNVTHELKSPVAAIKLHAQTLQQADLSTDERRRSLDYILQQTDRVASLVDDVLESSRLLSRRRPPAELVPVDVARFFDRWRDEARAKARGSGMELLVDQRSTGIVLGTRERLERVMNNLLDNALAHSHPGGEIRCAATDGDTEVTISIEDDGVGIPKGEHLRIFDRFYRAGREQRAGGTGLGLSIVSGLVEEMGGSVEATSNEGRPGARFTVNLPRLTP